MSMPKWLEILADVGPKVLLFTPLAPIAGTVIAAIGETKAMSGSTGQEKLAHVVNIATDAATVANAEAGHVVLDPAAVQLAAASAISTVVQVTNLVHAVHSDPTTPVASVKP